MVTTALKMLFIEKKKAMSLVFNLAIMICLSGVMLNMLENPKMQIVYLFINDVANSFYYFSEFSLIESDNSFSASSSKNLRG